MQVGARTLFFAYFAMVGALAPYISLYFADIGMSVAQIGVLMAVPQVTRIFGPPFWGAMLDRHGRPRRLLRASAALGLTVMIAFAWVGAHYAALIALLAVFHFTTSAQSPIAETMALSDSSGDPGAYGSIRMWGSIGFIVAVALTGPLLDVLGVRRLPALLALMCAALLAVALRLPAPRVPLTTAPARGAPAWARIREPVLAAFFASCFLMLFAHAALYAFYSLHLDRLGYSKTAIGLAWTLGVLAEIVVFRVQRRLFERTDTLRLLAFCMAGAVVRFALIGAGGDALWVVIVTQLLHGITFGLLHHSVVMALLHRWFATGQQGRAMAMYTTIGYGLGGSSGGISAGWLWSSLGPSAAFYGAAIAALLGWVAVAACRRFDYAVPQVRDADRDARANRRG
ncbi:MAG: MFS transporter [Burkholderiaceae bacterium]|nr:MFS transporter [Burkholderiaceae bacterium]